MAYDGWIEFADVEIVNLSRTAQIARTLGIDSVWTEPETVQWIEDALGGVGYEDVTNAPWYDEGFPASAEFAGVVPLSLSGLDDSTHEATTVEYVTNGGTSGTPRDKTLPVVGSVMIVATSERGADYGKRWFDRALAGRLAAYVGSSYMRSPRSCSGSQMRYFQFPQEDGKPVPPVVHRRNVTLSRGAQVTRKRSNYCSALWTLSFTLVANDPAEYGEPQERLTGLGASGGPSGSTDGGIMTEEIAFSCPEYDYTPIYDPLYPALVAPPTVPNFYPAGWTLLPGALYDRYWARISPTEPSALALVPVVTLTTDIQARFIRVAIWPATSAVTDTCDPMWSAIVSYVPAGVEFVIDGEQQAVYVWDGASPVVRRADSLVYGEGATPVQWASFNDPSGLLVTMDVFYESGDPSGGGTVRAALDLVPKSG